MENVFDTLGWHVAVRGSTRNLGDAETYSRLVDGYIVDAPYPFKIAGNFVEAMGRIGGTPVPLPTDVDGERITWVCTYFTTVAR